MILFIFFMATNITTRAMKKQLHSLKKGYDTIVYKTSSKFEKERSVESYYKKLEEMSDQTKNLISILTYQHFIPLHTHINIEDFSYELLDFVHLFHKEYEWPNGALPRKNQDETLKKIIQQLQNANQKFIKHKNNRAYHLHYEKGKAIKQLSSCLQTLTYKANNFKKAYESMDGNLQESNNQIFNKNIKQIKKTFLENKKIGAEKLSTWLFRRKYNILSTKLRYQLGEVFYHLYTDDMIKEKKDYKRIKHTLNITYYFMASPIYLLDSIDEIIQKPNLTFTKNMLDIVKLFYELDEFYSTFNKKKSRIKTLQKLQTTIQKALKSIKEINQHVKKTLKKNKKIEEKYCKNKNDLQKLQNYYHWDYLKATEQIEKTIKDFLNSMESF